jgi:hypothetical protein
MWKPGSSKPIKGLSSSALTPNKSREGTSAEGGTPGTPSSSSSADKKRLSGSTMNMRFMKRRKDATINNIFKTKENNKEKRKSDATAGDADASNNQNNKNKNNDSSVFQQLQHEEEKVVDMDVDNDDNDNNNNNLTEDCDSTTTSSDDDGDNVYGQATSVDMYGVEASIIGRRSFRGFNPAVERIWKDSKACLSENSSSADGNGNGNNHKLSDEELLLRYKDSAANATAADGGGIKIGNLDKKKKKKRR